MSALNVEDLTVTLEGNRILAGVTLGLESGEVVAVLGASGSGKSTLLRAIAGLIPSTGRIALGGESIGHLPTHRRGLGMMFQDHALFPHLSVQQNVAFGLEELGWEKPAIRQRVEELLELAELSDFGSRSVGSLSGGEAQRVALIRALAPQPRLLMLDEPLGSLDRRLRDELAEELHRLLALTGTTALYVTHDQSEAAVVADRIVVLAEGRLAADGTPESLWKYPPTPAMARFLGHRNVSESALVPMTAIALSEADSRPGLSEGVVRACRFADGLWQVTVVAEDVPGAHGLTEFHTTTTASLEVGNTVGLALDTRQIHAFGSVG